MVTLINTMYLSRVIHWWTATQLCFQELRAMLLTACIGGSYNMQQELCSSPGVMTHFWTPLWTPKQALKSRLVDISSKTGRIERRSMQLMQRSLQKSLQNGSSSCAPTDRTPSLWNGIWELSKLKTRLTLESNLLNSYIIWFQVFRKQSIHNQCHMAVAVHLAQYHLFRFLYTIENNVACKLIASQGDSHRLRECRLQCSESRKLLANLPNSEA